MRLVTGHSALVHAPGEWGIRPRAVVREAQVRGVALASWIRWTAVASGILALAGLSGVALGDMTWRDIGIVGYLPVFLVVVALLAVLFRRTPAGDT